VDGGGGHDTIRGSGRGDDLRGGTGSDTLSGNGGNDVLTGGSGNDTLEGGAGRDWLFGDAGSDTLFGDGGSDILTGGAGADIFAWRTGDADGARDRVKDFDFGEGDVLDFSKLLVDYDAGSDALTDFLSVDKTGSDTVIKVDTDGTGPGGPTLDVSLDNLDLFGAFGVDPGKDDELLAAMQNNGSLVT
jgi:Ca2+-binding RTX toxin-like protein